MRFLSKKRELNEWEVLENKEIDSMIEELTSISHLADEIGSIRELEVALKIFKKKRKPSLLNNIYARHKSLNPLFEDLNKKFGSFSSGLEKLEKIDHHIKKNYLLLKIFVEGKVFDLHFNKNKRLLIGRNSIPLLENLSIYGAPYVSREHLIISHHSGSFFCESIGSNPTVILDQNVGKTLNQQGFAICLENQKIVEVRLNLREYVYVNYVDGDYSYNNLVFSFEIKEFYN